VPKEKSTPIRSFLAEIVGMRALMLNLFAKASEGALSREDLRKISEYADAVKQRKADEVSCPEAQQRLQTLGVTQ
jgi:hypothetical protein